MNRLGKTTWTLLFTATAVTVALCLPGCGGKAGAAKVGAVKAGTTAVHIDSVAVLTVSSAREFIEALGSNRVIELEPGRYNLKPTAEGSFALAEGVSWEQSYDGFGLVLTGIRNLTIRGAGGADGGKPASELVVDPRSVCVLSFINCNDIVIDGVAAGHSDGGECSGGVFSFSESSRITVNGTYMYGSGTEGLTLTNVSDMRVTNSRIYECSRQILSIDGGGGITFENCEFHNNSGGVEIHDAKGVSFAGCRFRSNDGVQIYNVYDGAMFASNVPVAVSRSVFSGNKSAKFTVGIIGADLSFSDCVFDDAFTDARDNRTYPFVKTGGHTWMAWNLDYESDNSWCYGGADSNCVEYGRLYEWGAAKTACPAGWHLASRQEWAALAEAAGAEQAGAALKTKFEWGWSNDGNGNGEDSYNFSALPGGSRAVDGKFMNLGNRGLWWTADEFDSDSAYYRRMGHDYNYVYEGTFGKGNAFSVRCVKDD